MTSVQDIDLRDPQLTPSELSMLTGTLMKARDEYCNQGAAAASTTRSARRCHRYGTTPRPPAASPNCRATDFGSLDVRCRWTPHAPPRRSPRDQLGVHWPRLAGRPQPLIPRRFAEPLSASRPLRVPRGRPAHT